MDILTHNFSFETKNLNTFSFDFDIWFIAKEISDILGYSRTNKMLERLDDDEKKTIHRNSASISASFFGNQGALILINESGLYNGIFGSNMPLAKQFKKWITSEVLPSIRKTGNYSISQTSQLPKLTNEAEQIIELDNNFTATTNLLENLRNTNQIDLYRLDQFYRKFYNFSPLQTFEIDLDSQFFLPTELGKMINKSAVEVNLILENKGFQLRENGVWQITESGRDFGILIIGKYNQIKWKLKTIL